MKAAALKAGVLTQDVDLNALIDSRFMDAATS